ncbi:MAG: alkaline phosphatase family protein, partial [Acidimicrobiales bacterium]
MIIIMQENRSFDSYFGTFPGADGIPRANGTPTTCVPDPLRHACDRPFHDRADVNGGGPHGEVNAVADVHAGRMDGFVGQADHALRNCANPVDPACTLTPTGAEPDVMGYHTAAEIPNYWTYAKDFVLDDHMFEPVKSWSLPDHLYMISAWSAHCRDRSPMSCAGNIVGPYNYRVFNRAVSKELATGTTTIDLAWTDVTWLLHAHHVSWRYYVETGAQPDCANDSAETCRPVKQSYVTAGIWNPLPLFGDVHQDHQLQDVQPLSYYLSAASKCRLPPVAWINPTRADSEH